MKMFNKRQMGFTLIEVLVTVGILGALAAVVVPNVGRFSGRGADEAAKAELNMVQTAMDAAMAELQLQTVTATAAPISDFTVAGAIIDGTTKLYPNYLRVDKTGGASITYSWDAAGQITQAGTWK